MPSAKSTAALFLTGYAIVFLLRTLLGHPLLFFAGMLLTLALSVYLAKAVLARMAARERRFGHDLLSGPGLYNVVLLAFVPICLPLLYGFVWLYTQLA